MVYFSDQTGHKIKTRLFFQISWMQFLLHTLKNKHTNSNRRRGLCNLSSLFKKNGHDW